jgi:RND family efflux transporter MFP subunit
MMTLKICTLTMMAILLVACDKLPHAPPPPRPALVKVIGQTAVEQGMILVGEVKSRYESNLAFRIGGKINERKVEVGSLVKKGQVLANLDAADSNLTAAAAYASVRAAEASYALANAEVERQRMLFNKKFISASALDLREAELKTSAARLQQVKAQAAVSNNQSRYTSLIADRDGVVTQIRAEPGQVVGAGEMVAQVVDTQQIEVLVAVPESKVGTIKVGDSAELKLWANQLSSPDKTYSGKVREIAPAASSATRAFDVRVAILDVDEQLKLGMTAGVRFASNESSAELIVPSSALTQINGKNSVWVIDKVGIANPRAVTAGQFTENGVLVSDGLQVGEMVAIAGVHTLIKGQKVKPILQPEPSASSASEPIE